MALTTLLAVPLQLNGLLIMWKIHQAKQNDAIRAALLCDETALHVIDHLTHALLRRIHPGNRDEVFIWQNFPARLPTQAALSYEHIENFTKDLEVRRDLGNRARPVNRAHMKRPSNQSLRVTLVLCGKLKATIGQFLALVCNKVSLAGAVFFVFKFHFLGRSKVGRGKSFKYCG